MFNSAYPAREEIFSLCHINYINCYIIRINYNPRTESRADLCAGNLPSASIFHDSTLLKCQIHKGGCDKERGNFNRTFYLSSK